MKARTIISNIIAMIKLIIFVFAIGYLISEAQMGAMIKLNIKQSGANNNFTKKQDIDAHEPKGTDLPKIK